MSEELQPQVPKVLAAINRVQADLATEGIAKSQKNEQQGYKFRGIDSVYNTLCRILANRGLVIIPSYTNRQVTERTNRSGTTIFSVIVEGDYTIMSAEDGSAVVSHVIGEAMDSGDKATNKAMSAAHKYLCLQLFMIPTEGDNDADATTHEVSSADVAKQRVAELGGDPHVVQPKQSQKRQPKADKPKWGDAAKQKQFTDFCASSKELLKGLTGYDDEYYSIIGVWKHSTNVPDYDTARPIHKALGDRVTHLKRRSAALSEIADIHKAMGDAFDDSIESIDAGLICQQCGGRGYEGGNDIVSDPLITCSCMDGYTFRSASLEELYKVLEKLRAIPNNPSITNDDLPPNVSGKQEPEYITKLRALESRMVNEYRAGGRFSDILGDKGADSVDTVQTEAQAKAITKDVEDWIKEQPAKASQPMTLPAGVQRGFKK